MNTPEVKIEKRYKKGKRCTLRGDSSFGCPPSTITLERERVLGHVSLRAERSEELHPKSRPSRASDWNPCLIFVGS